MPNPALYFSIALAGGLGAVLRFLIDRSLASTPFPLSTFLINILGSFAIGFLFVLGSEKGIMARDLAAVLSVGLIGGFTTFSAYALQTALLTQNGQWQTAAIYFVLSPILATLAAFAGLALARLAF